MRMYFLHKILVLDIIVLEECSFVARKEANFVFLENKVVLNCVPELEIIYCILSVTSCVKINLITSVTIKRCHFNNDVNKYFNISKVIYELSSRLNPT